MARTQTKPATDVAPHAQTTARTATRTLTRPALARARYPRGAAAPVLVEVRRGPFVESRHRGHVVQVDASGRVERGVGDPDYVTSLRSAVKPFGVARAGRGGRRGGVPPDTAGARGDGRFASWRGHARAHAAGRVAARGSLAVAAGVRHRRRAAGCVDRRPPGAGRRGARRHPPQLFRLPRFEPATGTPRRLVARRLLASRSPRPRSRSQRWWRTSSARRPAALVTAVDNCGVLTYAFPAGRDRARVCPAGRPRGRRRRGHGWPDRVADQGARRR